MSSYKEGGYHQKYIISKANGNPVDPEAEYFLLRFDKDPHALKALYIYAKSVQIVNRQLHDDLMKKIEEYGDLLDYFTIKTINPGEAKCHQCKHRRPVPGDAHISCIRPDGSVKGDPHGIREGWFYYPIVFDPTWMITKCRNFEENK